MTVMWKHMAIFMLAGMYAMAALAEQGERWEVTGKMEMKGMPFAMPPQMQEVCIPKGKQGDPNYARKNDGSCKMTDVKQSGNTVSFKGSCVQEGRKMNMSGETRYDAGSFTSTMHMTGEGQDGQAMNVTLTSTGKKLGGSCDPEEQARARGAMVAEMKGRADAAAEMNRQSMAQACEMSSDGATLLAKSHYYLGASPMCKGKKAAYCSAVKSAVANDAQAFLQLQQHEQQIRDYSKNGGMVSVVQSCGINMRNTIATVCRASASKGPLDFLDANCPAEAKSYRELLRKQEACAGRGFTGATYDSDMKKCMGGKMPAAADMAGRGYTSGQAATKAAGTEDASGSDATNEAIKQGTKALKGLFGF